jgi:D-ribose pyranose/furanose isomerase RbsD
MKLNIQYLADFVQGIKLKAIEVNVNSQYTAKKIDLSSVSRFEILNTRMQKINRLRSQSIDHQDFYKALQAMYLINRIGIELSTTYNFTAI